MTTWEYTVVDKMTELLRHFLQKGPQEAPLPS